jgi:hypothetical protein
MSTWQQHAVEDKIVTVLMDAAYNEEHRFGRPFMSAYQLAIEINRLWPEVRQSFSKAHPVGGAGVGVRQSFAQYLARELSRRINAGSMPHVQGAFLGDQHLQALVYVDPDESEGGEVTSSLTGSGYQLSLYRYQ